MATNAQARLFAQLIENLEPEIRRAFMASVTDLQANVDWTALLDALQRYDTEAAIAALNIAPEAWAEYSTAMSAAYAKAGASTIAQIQASGIAGIGVRFQMTNPAAQQWIRENVGEAIVGFTREQIQIARQIIEAGYAQGMGPRNIAIDLVGRATGGKARTGGVLGLDAPRAERLMRVKQGMLTAEGVRDLVIEHADGSLNMRYAVNKATEQRILRAYRNGTAVPAADREISLRQYQNALLKSRADTVARTETGMSVMSARYQSWLQIAESQGLDASAIKKTWIHGAGRKGDYRPAHLALNGKSVQGLYTPFMVEGTPMQHALDKRGGARQVINCRCSTVFSLNQYAGL